MKKSDEIAYKLQFYIQSNMTDLIIPRIFLGGFYEADLAKITKSGIVYEYEIKISKSDFLKDFQKNSLSFNKITKHERLKKGELECNYFYFVVTEKLSKEIDVPDYCGLIVYMDNGTFQTRKLAKILHKRKTYSDVKKLTKLLHTLTVRCNNYSMKIRKMKNTQMF